MNDESLRVGDATEKLICALREELLEHGEMLALLDEQPKPGSGRSRFGLTDWLIAIRKQAAIIRVARILREQRRRELADSSVRGPKAVLPSSRECYPWEDEIS